jgi:hypothetical protein
MLASVLPVVAVIAAPASVIALVIRRVSRAV